MTVTTHFEKAEAKRIAAKIGIDWEAVPFELEQFQMGLEVELEHGAHDPETDVTHDDPILTGKIAWAHLKELPDYYTRLAAMEAAAEV
ncbi:MAG: hypothetical protein OEV29_03055 [Thermoleophilia bacterium]|nr:hypothetical protein [Thermoleophilia bacterium]